MRLALALALLLAAGAGPALAQAAPTASAPEASAIAAPEPPPAPFEDPLEAINRRMFSVDLTVNKLFAGHGRILFMAKWIPAPAREGLYNAFNNLEEPDTFANDLLQQKFRRAVDTCARFAVNSTIGGLGVIDVASRMGLRRTREDFGQTLAMWGMAAGPYVYVPLAGPTDIRDAASTIVDGFFLPGHWFPMTAWERQGMKPVRLVVAPATVGIRQVARGMAETGDTQDEYATLRQLFYDQRADQIADRPNLADNPVEAFPEGRKQNKRSPTPALPREGGDP